VARWPSCRRLARFEITEDEIADVVPFLESLTDERFLTDTTLSDPWRVDSVAAAALGMRPSAGAAGPR